MLDFQRQNFIFVSTFVSESTTETKPETVFDFCLWICLWRMRPGEKQGGGRREKRERAAPHPTVLPLSILTVRVP